MRFSTRTTVKSVRFSSLSQLQYIKYPSKKDKSAKWFSKEDRERFQRVMVKYAMICSNVLADADEIRDQGISRDFLICCVGLDHLISSNIPQRYQAIMAARKEHSRIVLKEQERQNKYEINCPEDLARVSKASSERSREHSHKIGKLVALI